MSPNGPSPSPADHSRLSRYMRTIVSALLTGLITFTLWDIHTDYRQTVATVEQETRVYARALDEHADRALGEAERALGTVVNTIEAAGGIAQTSQQHLQDLVTAHSRNAPQIGSIFVVNRSGTMLVNSHHAELNATSVTDQDYFSVHRNSPHATTYISAPFKCRFDGKWHFTISRSLQDRQGNFAGVAALALSIDYFRSFYKSFTTAADARLYLVRTDGTLLVEQPLQDSSFASDLKRRSTLISGRLQHPLAGTLHVSDPAITREPRIVSYESLSRYPVVAVISYSRGEALRAWQKRAITNLLTVGTLCGLAAFLATLLFRQLRTLEATHHQLVSQQESERKLTKSYKALSSCNKAVARAQSETALLDDVVRILHEDCDYSKIWFGLACDGEQQAIQPVATAGVESSFPAGIVASWGNNPNGNGPAGTAIRTGRPVVVEDIADGPPEDIWRQILGNRGYRSAVALPLKTGNQTIGALSVYADIPCAFSAEEIELLSEISSNVGYGLEAIQVRSELDRAMAEIYSLNQELERRVAERTTQLRSAIDALQEEVQQRSRAQDAVTLLNDDLLRQQNALVAANQEMESFSYSVSHDLRAPLRHLSGFVSILLEDYATTLDPTARHYLSRIDNASKKMGILIDSLLELSRISQHRMEITPVNLSELAREIVEAHRETGADRLVEWRIADDLTAAADEALMRNVLQNLLGNAWKYSGMKDAAVIEFAAREDGEETVYYVRDNGAGFDMQYGDKLFGAFQRLHGAEFDGTGIGLATVKRIITRHKGEIWAEGIPDEGATFFFTLQS